MKKLISYLSLLTLGICLFTGCGNDKGTSTEETTEASADEMTAEAPTDDTASSGDTKELLTGTHHVEIDVKDYGIISVELYADIAPVTVTNFVKLAESGFYNGLTFHRIIDGFMIQGGDPNGNGTGGSDETITGEFEANGYTNSLSHVRGTISMARSQSYDSASSQFFIMQADADYLDGQYAAFGTVTDGMDIVDKICEDANPTDSNGTIPSDEQPVITEIRVVD